MGLNLEPLPSQVAQSCLPSWAPGRHQDHLGAQDSLPTHLRGETRDRRPRVPTGGHPLCRDSWAPLICTTELVTQRGRSRLRVHGTPPEEQGVTTG